MPAQRFTIAKIAGVAADAVLARFRRWQGSPDDATDADDFAERLRANGFAPPVVHFVEWADLWSMGDLASRWLPTSANGSRYDIHVHELPDGGRLARLLADAGPQQFDESDAFVRRLAEAVAAWEALVDRAVVVVLRYVVGGFVTDDEVTASLGRIPGWIDPPAVVS